MQRSMAVALASAMLLTTPAMAQSQNWLVGSWTMVSATQTVDGRPQDYFGPHPLGQVIFGPDGHFSNILLRGDLAKFAQNNRLLGTPEENTAVVKGSIAYFGTYSLTDDTLKMHITASSFPNWTGTDQTRRVHLAGNQLIWENAAASGGGGGVKQVYERAK
jgi:Lipocalin-like domain